ncbi:MAG: 2,4-dihydroxyhept-2-ene-1,7-dioic acid aldolase [Deltaproteobacteria bacterium]|nr:2,4-dihydroxyhept-2-ene-1,7-dioic acid aldolase [Deltaproteobacteria bacterium]
MKKNRLRELLNEGKPTLGTHIITPWPGMVEVIGQSGAFDYIEYVGEYSPFSLDLLDNLGRAIELFPDMSSMMKVEEQTRGFFPDMSSMMKVEEQTRGFIATRAIDAGIQNVLFTDCRSAAEVRECVRLVRTETPEAGGTHGASMRRNVGYCSEPGSEAWVKAMNEVVIAIMIEKKGAIENLEEILSVEGVDMVQFGPADYSISIGKPGQRESAEVKKAHRNMIEIAIKKGVAPRVEVAGFEQAKPYLDIGVRHFCIGWDIVVIFNWCRNQAEGMKELFDSV